MKKKNCICILVIATLLVLWIGVFIIDYIRCNNLKMPIFVFSNENSDDGGSGTYYGLGYKVRVEKYISAEYGAEIQSLTMSFLGKVVSASISDKVDENRGDKSFVATVLEEKETYIIVEPNKNEQERKSADKISINFGKNNSDKLYGVGTKVIIKYSGSIIETFPAQINTDDITVLN